MCSSGERVSLLCVDKHPTQPHLLAAGGQDGVLSIWDMRQELYPVTLLEAHAAESESYLKVCIKYFSRLFRTFLTDPISSGRIYGIDSKSELFWFSLHDKIKKSGGY